MKIMKILEKDLEFTIQSFVEHSAYEHFLTVHRSHSAGLKHRAIIGIECAHPGVIGQSILDA